MNAFFEFIKNLFSRTPVGVRVGNVFRYDEAPLDIFQTIARHGIHAIWIKGTRYKVKGGSLRYLVFNKSKVCPCCGLVANVAYFEKVHLESKTFYVNLYGREADGTLTLFSKDHIRPKAKNGTDSISNLQTMCVPCNCKKGDTFSTGKPNKNTLRYKKIVEKRRLKREAKATQENTGVEEV